jgi:hypothetical protein
MWAVQLSWKNMGLETATGPSLLIVPLVTILLYLASFTVTHFMRRIPILKYTVP